jgi:hypothetical protein
VAQVLAVAVALELALALLEQHHFLDTQQVQVVLLLLTEQVKPLLEVVDILLAVVVLAFQMLDTKMVLQAAMVV